MASATGPGIGALSAWWRRHPGGLPLRIA